MKKFELNKTVKAFTLAEVLITLGVIGIVAAMTIPTLVQSYKKKVILTQLKKSYSVLQNAIALSEVDNGKFSTWPTGASMEAISYFETYFKPYFTDVQLCYTAEDCGYVDFNNRKWTNDGLNWTVKTTSTRCLFKFANNVVFIPRNSTDKESQITYTEDVYLDVNGSSGPNIGGADVFTLERTNDGILPKQSDTCTEKDASGCLKKIIENGWEFPENYPFKF